MIRYLFYDSQYYVILMFNWDLNELSSFFSAFLHFSLLLVLKVKAGINYGMCMCAWQRKVEGKKELEKLEEKFQYLLFCTRWKIRGVIFLYCQTFSLSIFNYLWIICALVWSADNLSFTYKARLLFCNFCKFNWMKRTLLVIVLKMKLSLFEICERAGPP